MRLSLRRVAAAALVLAGASLLTGGMLEELARRDARQQFPVQGRLVDIGGRRLQLDCRGSGSPTVIFEAGLDMLGSLSWAAVHDSVARTTRACAYSRAGIMWSDASPIPFSGAQVARDLRAALAGAGETGPFVMVGHSLGGPYAMQFSALYASEVSGVVLVDASHPDQVAQLEQATGKRMTPPAGPLVFGAAIARTGVTRLLTRDVAPARASDRVREMSAAYAATSLAALARETAAVRNSLTETPRDLGSRPLIVLAAAAEMGPAELARQGMTPEQGKAFRTAWAKLQEDERTWSRRGQLVSVPDATHSIQVDRPDVVIAAVRNVVRAVR